jgi:hypothetical protein
VKSGALGGRSRSRVGEDGVIETSMLMLGQLDLSASVPPGRILLRPAPDVSPVQLTPLFRCGREATVSCNSSFGTRR